MEQHREKLKDLFLSNGYSLGNYWLSAIGSICSDNSDWLRSFVIAVIKEEKITSISGNVFITGTRRFEGSNIAFPTFVSFYFRKFNNLWKLAVRDGYFVEPYEDEGSKAIDIPPEIYSGINQIFPEQFTVDY